MLSADLVWNSAYVKSKKKTISRPIHRTDSQKQDRCAFLQPLHVWRPDDFPPVILMLCPSIVLESVCGVENSEAVNEQNE